MAALAALVCPAPGCDVMLDVESSVLAVALDGTPFVRLVLAADAQEHLRETHHVVR